MAPKEPDLDEEEMGEEEIDLSGESESESEIDEEMEEDLSLDDDEEDVERPGVTGQIEVVVDGFGFPDLQFELRLLGLE